MYIKQTLNIHGSHSYEIIIQIKYCHKITISYVIDIAYLLSSKSVLFSRFCWKLKLPNRFFAECLILIIYVALLYYILFLRQYVPIICQFCFAAGREIAEVKLSGANYALMGLFIVIATAAIVTLIIIHILHTCPQFCNKVRHHVKCISINKKSQHMNPHFTNGSTVNPEYASGGGAGDKSFATSSTNVSAWSSPNGTVHNSQAEIV